MLPKPKIVIREKQDDSVKQLNYLAVAAYDNSGNQKTIIDLLTSMIDEMKQLTSFLRDSSQRQSETVEKQDIVPKKREDKVKKSSFELPTSLAELFSILGITTAVLTIGAAFTALNKDVRETVKEIISFTVLFKEKVPLAIEGLLTAGTKSISLITKGITSALSSLLDSISGIGKLISRIKLEFTTTFFKSIETALVKAMKEGLLTLDEVKDILRGIDDGIDSWKAALKPIVKTISFIGDSFKESFSMLTKIGETVFSFAKFLTKGIFKPLELVLEPIIKALRVTFDVVKAGIGKFLLPLQILLSAIDFISGFISGYAEGGFKEAFRKGLMAVYDGLITGTIDLIKDVVTWVLDKVGLKNLSEAMGKYVENISKNLQDLMKSIVDLFIGIATLDLDAIWKSLGHGASSLKNFVSDTIGDTYNIIVGLLNDIVENFGDEVKKIGSKIKDAIISSFTSLTDNIKKWLGFDSPEQTTSLPPTAFSTGIQSTPNVLRPIQDTQLDILQQNIKKYQAATEALQKQKDKSNSNTNNMFYTAPSVTRGSAQVIPMVTKERASPANPLNRGN